MSFSPHPSRSCTLFLLLLLTTQLLSAQETATPLVALPDQPYLLPLPVEKLEAQARAEILRKKPELKAEDLKFQSLNFLLMADPDYALVPQGDGNYKKEFISANYQTLSMNYLVLASRREQEQNGERSAVYDLLVVNFPNARTLKFRISTGTTTQRLP